jgi:polyphosphate kinase
MVRSDDNRRARLNVITHLLSKIPYKKTRRDKVKLPKRQRAHGYREPNYPFKSQGSRQGTPAPTGRVRG